MKTSGWLVEAIKCPSEFVTMRDVVTCGWAMLVQPNSRLTQMTALPPDGGLFKVQVRSSNEDNFIVDYVQITTEGSRTFRADFTNDWVQWCNPERSAYEIIN